MANNYYEINEKFKLQAQHLFVATSSESNELFFNMDNYTFVTNNKMFNHTVNIAIEEKQEYLIISSIESNVEAQTQIKLKKPSKRYNLIQRQECKQNNFLKKMKLLWMLKLIFYNKDQ